jgi:hypothetical protein
LTAVLRASCRPVTRLLLALTSAWRAANSRIDGAAMASRMAAMARVISSSIRLKPRASAWKSQDMRLSLAAHDQPAVPLTVCLSVTG